MIRSALVLLGAWCLLSLGLGQPLQAQSQSRGFCLKPSPIPGGASALFVSPSGDLCQGLPDTPALSMENQSIEERRPRPGSALVFSAILPGLGQQAQGHGRWTAYAAAQVWAWIQHLDHRREGKALQEEYRDLAWLVARRVSSGPRNDGAWEYYEALTKYEASGAYDEDPLTSGVQPEGDPGTYNGSMWVLAQQIYLPGDPETPVEEGSEQYEQALDYYNSRAYAPTMAWDWAGNALHQAEYVNLIRSSDQNLKSSTTMIGVILANHLLSAIDALVSGRLAIAEREEPLFEVLMFPGTFASHEVALRVRLPNW